MERTLTLDITDEAAKDIFDLAAAHGSSVGELIGDLISDLTCGCRHDRSGRSDLAGDWFSRYQSGKFPKSTFINHLIGLETVDDLLEDLDIADRAEQMIKTVGSGDIEDYKIDLKFATENIKSYYDEYVEYCPKGEEPQSYGDAVADLRRYKKTRDAWMGEGGSHGKG